MVSQLMDRFGSRVRTVRRESPGTLLALETVLLGLILLFFLQLFSTVITSMFAQGLEHRSVPLAAFALTLFLAPVFTVMFYKRSLERRFSFVLAAIALLSRGLTPHFAVIGRLVLSATGTAALLLFFTSYFALKHTVRKWYSLTLDESYAVSAGVSLAIAVCLSIFFRTLGVTVDVSMDCFDWYPLIGWVLVAIAAGLLLVMWAAGAADPDHPEQTDAHSASLLGQHPAAEGRSDFPPALFRHETHGGLALDPGQTACMELIPWEEGAHSSYHQQTGDHAPAPAAAADVDDLEPSLWGQVLLSAAWLTTISLVLFAGLNSPTVLARWGNTHYPSVNSVAMLSAAVFIFVAVYFPAVFRKVPSSAILMADLTLIALLLVASLSNLAKNPHWNALQSAMIYPAIALSPVVYLHFSHLSSVLAFVDSSSSHRGLAFAVASFLLFFLVAAAIFTLTSSYVGVAVFRDLYWVVLFLVVTITVSGAVAASRYFKKYTESARSWYPAAVAVAGPVSAQDTASHPSHSTEHRPLLSKRVRWGLLGGVALLTVVVIACSFTMVPDPPAAESPSGHIRMITYNILQGYTQHGTPNFRLLARDLDRLNLDVIAFQESDTARLSGANQDVVRFLAYHLNLHSYYGPKPTTGTYGLSLLSRFPIDWQTLWYLPSKNEQIACVEARIRVAADKQLNLFVTHFGFRFEEDQVKQANYMLDLIGDRPNAVMVCDCNMHPLTNPYNITTSVLNDAWAVSTGSTDGGFTFEADDPYERIDYIFPSKDVKIRTATVLSNVKDSDHLPVLAELQIHNAEAQEIAPLDDVAFHN